jgi:HPt (histidine-containing phosphotransfer) domain-containing protein
MTPSPLIDTDSLARLEQDVGPQVVSRIIEMFLEQGPDRLQAVRDGVGSADLSRVAEALHLIKSSAGMLGAAALSEVAERAEQLAREGHAADVASLMDSLESVFEQTTAFLRRRGQELGSTG